MDVSDLDDLYDFFNQPLSPETLIGDLDQFSQSQPTHFKGVTLSTDKMGIQRKLRSTFQELLESQPRRDAPTKAPQTRLPTPPPTQPLRVDPVDQKRKREDKRKEVMEGGKNQPSIETEHQRATKQPRTVQTRSTTKGDKRVDYQATALFGPYK